MGGMMEYAASPELKKMIEEYVQYSHKTDLADILSNYVTAPGSYFLVAELKGDVVGCVGLQPCTIGDPRYYKRNVAPYQKGRELVCELRRMSVSQKHRGKKIAQTLFHAFQERAKQAGYHRIHLTTGTHMREANIFWRYSCKCLYKGNNAIHYGLTLVRNPKGIQSRM